MNNDGLILLIIGFAFGYSLHRIPSYLSYWRGQKYGYKMGLQHRKLAEIQLQEHEDHVNAFVSLRMDRQ